MSASIAAIWKDMKQEDYESQPYPGDGGASWALWLAEVQERRWLSMRVSWWGCAAILTYKVEGMSDTDVHWVTPDKLIESAERLRTFVEQKTPKVAKIVEIYTKNACGAKHPHEEFVDDLNSIIEIARFVQAAGGAEMTFEVLF